MSHKRLILLAIVAGLAGLFASFYWQDIDEPPPPPPMELPPAVQLEQLPAFSYPDLSGKLRHASEWNDKVLVLNFWATWCPPCREETPLFVALQEEYRSKGVQFVGLAIDDHDAVEAFTDTYGVDYPMLLGDMSAMELGRQLGNRFGALPYTLIVAPGGKIVVRHAGGMKRGQIEPLLKQLIAR